MEKQTSAQPTNELSQIIKNASKEQPKGIQAPKLDELFEHVDLGDNVMISHRS